MLWRQAGIIDPSDNGILLVMGGTGLVSVHGLWLVLHLMLINFSLLSYP
jgi:hypothetical protein